MDIEQYDEREIRCPRMGDFVPFKYCRTCGSPFCRLIISCWAVKLDIGSFLAEHYDAETIHAGLEKPAVGRVGTILELSERYRQR